MNRFFVKLLVTATLLSPLAALSKNPPAAAATPAPAQTPTKDAGFNKSEIQARYFNGEFEPLISLLEHLRYQRRLQDKEDSLFIFKYLGVVYGADEATRQKAESFMYAMLKLNPGADLTDMGVGDNIENLFKKVRERYQQTYRDTTFDKQKQIILQQFTIDSLHRDSVQRAKAAASAPAGREAGDKRKWMWAAIGGGVLVATVGTIIAFSGDAPARQVDSIVTPIK